MHKAVMGMWAAGAMGMMAATTGGAADCLVQVEIGDPGFVVMEKCGEPERRERYEHSRTTPIDVIKGNTSLQAFPLPPKLIEKWYYDTTLNTATVITIEDRGVIGKERLIREGGEGVRMD